VGSHRRSVGHTLTADGFISQRSKVGVKHRQHVWNEAKYCSIPHAPKDAKSVESIRRKAEEFLDLFKPRQVGQLSAQAKTRA